MNDFISKTKPVLSVKNISCGYQDTEILHGISFDVFPNEKLCILGPNGCGKTTLLRAVSHILPFKGEITACGYSLKKIRRTQIAKIMGYMSQHHTVYFPYTVYETVMMGRYAHHSSIFSKSNAEDKKIVKESLMQTGLWEMKDKPLQELSGGQFQRAMLSRLFAQSPDIILLDEPTNHLDLKYQIELIEYLNQWVKKKNRCIVSVLHDINMALSFADTILLMKHGICIFHASAKDFPLEKINEVYEMNISGYMQKTLSLWGR